MLKLKRRVHERIVMSHNRTYATATITVQAISKGQVDLLFELPLGRQRYEHLVQGAPLKLHFAGCDVEMHLRSVARHEAYMGFVAPYEIRFERPERLQEKQGNKL